MLADYTPVANVATSDIAKARSFYEGVLGMKVLTEVGEAGVVVYSAGSGTLLLYASEYAGTNKATSVGFQIPLEVFDSEVAALREGGVTFDTFEAPGLTWDGDVAVSNGGHGKAVWFRDLDGNIIGVTAGQMG
jgi:catechol 2,3-dioxygenase-like lactoylglutathione lyase family enzyme